MAEPGPVGGAPPAKTGPAARRDIYAVLDLLAKHVKTLSDGQQINDTYNKWLADNKDLLSKDLRVAVKQKVFVLAFTAIRPDHTAPSKADLEKFNAWLKEHPNASEEDIILTSAYISLQGSAPSDAAIERFHEAMANFKKENGGRAPSVPELLDLAQKSVPLPKKQ